MADFDYNAGPDKEIDLGGMNRKVIPPLYGDLPYSNVARNCLEALSIEAMGYRPSKWLPREKLGSYDPNDGPEDQNKSTK